MPLIRSNNVLALRALCAFAVVLAHASNSRLYPSVLAGLGATKSFIPWSTLAFYAVAGWLHAYSDAVHPADFRNYTVKRLRRLLIPFLALTLGYCLVWEVLDQLDMWGFQTPPPDSFWAKLGHSLWPLAGYSWTAGCQLYFLLSLFLISLSVHGLLKILNPTCFLGAIFLLIGACLVCYPQAYAGGFTLGGVLWGGMFYLLGFLLQRTSLLNRRVLVVLAFLLPAAVLGGWTNVYMTVPLMLIALSSVLPFGRLRALQVLGRSSGTVFIYHAPFILIPLVILASCVHSPLWQGVAVAGAIGLTIGGLTLLHRALSPTRYRFLLM